MHASWVLHPDRAFPAEPGTRAIARALHAQVAHLPIVSMHGHIDAELIASDANFTDPASLLVTPDHYLVRMLVSQGIPMTELMSAPAGSAPAEVTATSRAVWRLFCENWRLFRGTPTRYWLDHVLIDLFELTAEPSAESTDLLFDDISAKLHDAAFRPRALFDRFNLEVLATTDSATSALEHHRTLAADGWGGRVIPTFRPDSLLHLGSAGWRQQLSRLEELTDTETASFDGFLRALAERRRQFVAAGARATDHGHDSASCERLPIRVASAIFDRARAGDAVSLAETRAFAGSMLFEMARMSCNDGLVMQLHSGVLRNHDTRTHAKFGPDRGYDIPVAEEFTRSLRPILEAFGHHPTFRLVVFTVDEGTYTRELAPLAGVYPAMKLGAPWWFLDSPDGMRRFREAVTETAGFYNTTGFVDDTRAFCSIPARHDLARRVDASYLARLVAEHHLREDEAADVLIDLTSRIPRASYPALMEMS